MEWLAIAVVLALLVAGIVAAYRVPKFRVIPIEQTEWGTLFAVVDAWGRRHFIGRYKVAREQLFAMNSKKSSG